MNQQEINKMLNKRLVMACTKGDLAQVHYLLAASEVRQKYKAQPASCVHVNIHYKNDLPLMEACNNGHLPVVRFLLSSPQLSEGAHIGAQDGEALVLSGAKGHLEVVKYLLTSPELKEHADITAQDHRPLRAACSSGHLKVVKYLLSSPGIGANAQKTVDIHAHGDDALVKAFLQGHIKTVRFLMSAILKQEGIDALRHSLHAQGDVIFLEACRKKNKEFIKQMVCDYGLQRNATIDKAIKKYPLLELGKLFDYMTLHQQLQGAGPDLHKRNKI